MNYFSAGRGRLINDILSPFDRGGYKYDHPNVRNQPIGRLNRQFRRKYAVKPQVAKTEPVPVKKRYAIVPPLATLPEKQANRAWLKYAIAITLIILLIGLMWLIHPKTGTRPKQTAARIIPINSVTIPLDQNNGSAGGNGGSNSSSPTGAQTAAGANGGATNSGYSTGTLQGTSATSSSGSPAVGGRGGGPATSSTGSSGGTGSQGVLPINLTIPPVDTSADSKTLLDTSGTTITVN